MGLSMRIEVGAGRNTALSVVTKFVDMETMFAGGKTADFTNKLGRAVGFLTLT